MSIRQAFEPSEATTHVDKTVIAKPGFDLSDMVENEHTAIDYDVRMVSIPFNA